MLMSITSVSRHFGGRRGYTKDDVAEVVSKTHGKGRSKTGRRAVKRGANHKLRQSIRNGEL